MDAYTAETREWLDRRYDRVDADGVYVAHQPIYGFRAGHCEPRLFERYARTLAILRALSRLRFDSCLDADAGARIAPTRRVKARDVPGFTVAPFRPPAS